MIVPIGGGGLCAGVAAAVKLVRPRCLVFGVEPEGADSMRRSLAAGSPQSIDAVRTIADSLGAPYAAPYSFDVVRRNIDDLVLVDDDALRRAMLLLFASAKLAVEPAGAAATAALCGPLRERLDGKRVGLIVCGANIDAENFFTVPEPGPRDRRGPRIERRRPRASLHPALLRDVRVHLHRLPLRLPAPAHGALPDPRPRRRARSRRGCSSAS